MHILPIRKESLLHLGWFYRTLDRERLGRNNDIFPGSCLIHNETPAFSDNEEGSFAGLRGTQFHRAEFQSRALGFFSKWQSSAFSLLWLFRNRSYALHKRNKFPKIVAVICLLTLGIVRSIPVCVRKWHKPISLDETKIYYYFSEHKSGNRFSAHYLRLTFPAP